MSEWSGRGVCRVAVAPLRREPAHAAERVSEILFGETFTVEEQRASADGGLWLRVRAEADDYRGWLRAWYAEPASEAAGETGGGSGEETARVSARCLEVRAGASARDPVRLALPRGARVRIGARRGRWIEVSGPGGLAGQAPASGLAAGEPAGGPATPRRLVGTAEAFLGAPYLWGGRTPWGIDCSGYVQAVYAWHGLAIPRDAADQLRSAPAWGRRRRGGGAPGAGGSAGSARAGDLLFFGDPGQGADHVAISLGNNDFLHAHGWVRRGSLEAGSQFAEPRLAGRFLGAWGRRRSPTPGNPASPESA